MAGDLKNFELRLKSRSFGKSPSLGTFAAEVSVVRAGLQGAAEDRTWEDSRKSLIYIYAVLFLIYFCLYYI